MKRVLHPQLSKPAVDLIPLTFAANGKKQRKEENSSQSETSFVGGILETQCVGIRYYRGAASVEANGCSIVVAFIRQSLSK
jgi:hypothetical protein